MSHGPALALIRKNSSEAIRVSLDEFKGAHFVDVRVVIPAETEGGNAIFTKKGVTVPIPRLPALIDALQRALDEARRAGLFDEKRAEAA